MFGNDIQHVKLVILSNCCWHSEQNQLDIRNASRNHASHFENRVLIIFWFYPVVLHTGKRWFIICPVDEPSVCQDMSSDGATATPHTSGLSDGTALSQAADSSTAQPVEHCTAPTSTGNVKFSSILKSNADVHLQCCLFKPS